MTRILVAASAFALAALPAAALAQDVQSQTGTPRFYGTVGYSQFETPQADLGAVTVRGGWKVWRYLGVEGEGSIGVDGQSFDVSVGGSGGVIELKHDIAAYAVAFLPLGDRVQLHARAGFGSARIEASAPGVYAEGAGESFNYGLGASAFSGANGVRLDWTGKDFRDTHRQTDIWTVSYVRRF